MRMQRKGVMTDTMKRLVSLLILSSLAGIVYATTYQPSQYVGTPTNTTCSTCDDGTAQLRFANASVVDDASNTATGKAFKFDVQLRFLPGQTITNTNLADVAIYIQYNTDAFGESVHTNTKCSYTNGTVTATPGAFTRVPNDNTSSILAITYNSNAKAFGPAAPANFLSPITSAYQTVVTVQCQIADLSQTAGVALHALSWNQTTTIRGANTQDKFVTTAESSLTGFRLDGAPSVLSYALWDQNSGMEITFDTPVTVDTAATYTFGVRADSATGTEIVTTLSSTQIEVNNAVVTLKDLYTTGGERPNLTQMWVVVGANVVKNASDPSKTHAAATALFELPQYDDTKNPLVIGTSLNADNTTLTISFNISITTPTVSAFQLTSNLSPAPTITGVSRSGAQALLTLSGAGSKLGTDTISLRLGNTAVASADSTTDYAAPIQRELQNISLNDSIAPNVAYTLTAFDKSATKNTNSDFVDYDTLTYRVDIDEQNLSGVTFGLYGATADGTESVVSGVTVVPGSADTSVSGRTRYNVSINGTISWNSKATDPIAYYYIRVTAGTDSGSNNIPVTAPPVAQRGVPVSIRGVAALIADTNDFYVTIDFGSAATGLDASKESGIVLRLKTADTITSATIVSGSLSAGKPADAVANTDFNDLVAGQSVYFRVKPTGTLDGGESAAGAEVLEVSLPASLVTVDGESNSTDPIDVQAIENGAPEIVSFELDSQNKTLACGQSTAAAPNCTLGDIVYKLMLTEAVSGLTDASNQIKLYRSAAEAGSLATALNSGKVFAAADYVDQGSTGTITAVTGDSKSYLVTFSGVAHSNATSNTNSFVAVVDGTLFGGDVQDSGGAKLEDCQGMMWYGGAVRTATRDTACLSQNAAEAPLPGLPTVALIPDGDGDNIVGTGPNRVVYVARAGLAIESFAERLRFFGLQMKSGSSVKQLQVFKSASGTRGDKLDFMLQESNVDQDVEWEAADSRGFSAGALSQVTDKLRVIRDVSLSRERGFIGTDGTSFSARVLTDKGDSALATVMLNAVGSDGSVSANIAANDTISTATIAIDAAVNAVAYRISTGGSVWAIGDSLRGLTVAGALALGRVPEIQISRIDLATRPITFGEISVSAVSNNQSSVSIGFEGPTGGSYSAATTGTAGGISSVTGAGANATSPLALTVNWSDDAATVNSMLGVTITHSAGESATIQLHFPPVRDTDLDGADSDGDGIPTDSIDTNDTVTALPVAYTATSLSFMHPAGSADVRTSKRGLRRVTTSPTLRQFRANEAVDDKNATYTFMLHNGLPDIAGGAFASGKIGTVIPLPKADSWSPQGLTAATGGTFGMFDSNGMGCPADADAGAGSSPYRDASGNLQSGAMGDCMVLYIEDGSTSDADGAVNGSVDGDLITLVAGVSVAPFRRGGGGGAVSGVELYGLLTLLALSLGYGLMRRRRVSRSKMN